jgi:alpha-ketoglutarate-dependent taurine dioxygenase
MKYRLHENGWTVIIDDFDLRTATQHDINQTARLIASNTCVVFKKQNLSIEDEIKIAKMFKNPQAFDTDSDKWSSYKGCEVPEAGGIMFRVTGELDDQGRPGLAGWEGELHWHCNDATTPDRRSMVWLYGVRGTKGSKTSWNNNVLSYETLDLERRQTLENLTWIPYGDTSYYDSIFTDLDSSTHPNIASQYAPNLVMKNIAGKKGFYFPFYQIYGFNGMTRTASKEIIDWLSEYTIQEKFCYHHEWEDGDLVISEQWLGVHKRWPFKEIKTRLLHRMAFDFPDQDYSKI